MGRNAAQDVLASIAANVGLERDAGQLDLSRHRIITPVSKGGGWTPVVINVAVLGTAPNGAPYPGDLNGFAVIFCRDGSTPGVVLDFDFDGGGREETVFPGNEFIGRFTKLAVRLSAQNLVTQGTVKLLLLRSPEVQYDELPPGIFAGAPSQATMSPAAGNGVGTNVPTLSTQGILIGGRVGIRTMVAASDATGAAGQVTYSGQTGNFTVGQVVTAASGGTGTILSDADAGATGALQLSGVTGVFTPGTALTDPLGGAATVATGLTAVRTIVTGEIHYWLYDPTSGLWGEGPISSDLSRATPRGVVVTEDDEFSVPFGRVFAELRNYTEDAGTASPALVRTTMWGAL